MANPRVTVYTPQSPLIDPVTMARSMLRDLAAARELAWHLAARDIRAQYRQAYLGILWAFIVPLANAAIWIFLNHTGTVSMADTVLPYGFYAFSGAMLWSIFMDAVGAPLQQTNAARTMLAKLNFPREAIVLSGIYQTLLNAGIKSLMLLGALLLVGLPTSWSLVLFPLGVIALVLAGTAVGVLITPVGVLYADVGRGLPLLMQFLMFLSPVVLPMPREGWAATLFTINPLTPLVLSARDWLTGASPEYLLYFATVNVAAAALLVLVWAAYRLAMPILIERISA
jgi:lipopolysaccharide transport system permease protein